MLEKAEDINSKIFINEQRKIFSIKELSLPNAIQMLDPEGAPDVEYDVDKSSSRRPLKHQTQKEQTIYCSNDLSDLNQKNMSSSLNHYRTKLGSKQIQKTHMAQLIAEEQIDQHRKSSSYIGGFQARVWRQGALRIVYYISKFIQSMKEIAETTKFRLLNPKIFKLINDQSSDYDYYLRNNQIKGSINIWKKCQKQLRGICQTYLPVNITTINQLSAIQPDGYFKIMWDSFVVFIIFINMFYIPLKLAFNMQQNQRDILSFFLNDIPSLVFLIEILLNFNTAYYEQGKINSNHKYIIFNYIKGNFLYDAIVLIPFFTSKYQIKYIDILLLLRITRVSSMFNNIEEVLNLRERFAALIDLIRLIFFVILVGHFCACVLYYLGTTEGQNSWIYSYDLSDASTSSKYINSLYWSVITLLTVGYGDMVPKNDTEKCFIIAMSLVTCGVFGYAINSIGAIFKEIEDKKENFRNQMALINSYMRRNGLNIQLQLKVRKYFEYYFKRQEEYDEKVRLLLQELTPDLKKEVLIDMHKKIIMRSKLLRENLSDDCIRLLCLFLKEQKLSPDEIIFNKDKRVDKLYFISRGRIKIYFSKTNPIQTLEIKNFTIRNFGAGYVLGEKNFLQQTVMEYMAQSAGFSSVFYLDYKEFLSCLKLFPNDFEKICTLKDKLYFNPIFKKFFTVCEVCSGSHTFCKCPYPFHQLNKTKIIMRGNQSKPQNRYSFERIQKKKQKINRELLLHAGLAICLNEKFLEEQDLNDDYLYNLGFDDSDQKSQNNIKCRESEYKSGDIQKSVELTPLLQRESDSILFGSGNLSSQNIERSPILVDQNIKGILKKKTTFVLDSVRGQYSERDPSISEKNEELNDSDEVVYKRKERNHMNRLSNYTRANSFIQKFKLLQLTFQNSKSFHEDNNLKNSQNKIRMKHSELIRQVTNTTVKPSVEEIQQVQEGPPKIQNFIKEDVLFDLDRQKIYNTYFPQFNVDIILKRIQVFQKNREMIQNNRNTSLKNLSGKATMIKQKLHGTGYLNVLPIRKNA